MTEMKGFILFIGLILSTIQLWAQPVLAPTQTDQIIIDNQTPGSADPNDRIRYTVTIQNTGGAPAILVQLNAVLDGRTTLVPGSFKSSPLAINDAYTATGNVGISVAAGSGLKANDFDDNIPALTIVAGTFTTTGGGSITIAADGSFTYNPAAGFTGADTYVYTLTDSDPVGLPVPLTDMGTVTITVSNMIWFVDNTGGGSGGTGTLANPFKTLGDFNASSGPLAGQLIFIKNTGTNYNGGIVLKDNQIVYGTGHTGGANLANVLPFSLASNSVALPAINGTPPVITNTASGDGVTLASGNSLRGFNVGACFDFGMDNTTTLTIGNLVVSEVAINNTTGGGFDASNGSGASMNVVFSSISSTNGVNGIDLTNCAGTFTVNGGTITNPTGTGVLISGGSVTFSSSGAISDNSGFAVDIDNHDSNNVTFSGNITSTGTGIRVQNCGGGTITFSGTSKSLTTGTNSGVTLSSNAGATITLSGGGLVITTTSGTGFNTTGGATAVNVTGAGNTISSPTGTALNVNATTIGSGNLNFQSISSASSAAPTGIILDNTGSSGGLIVTGTGSAGSGGTIANKTGADGSTSTGIGIYLNNTSNVSLSRMQINDTQNFGILGNNTTNFTMSNSVISGVNGTLAGGSGEGSIYLLNLFGTNSVSSCTISGGIVENFTVVNNSGTLNSLNVSNCTIQNNSTVSGNMGMSILSQVSANMTATIDGCTFKGNRTIAIRGDAADASILNVTFTNNSITPGTGGNNQGNQGIEVSRALTSSVTYNVTGNTITGMISTLINIFSGGGNATATVGMTGVVKNNIVTGTGAGGNQFGIRVFESGSSATGSGFIYANVSGNTVSQIDNAYGILVESSGSTGNPGMVQASVLNNNVSVVGTALDCIRMQARNNHVMCAKISGNTTNSGGVGFYGIQLRQANTSTLRLEGLTAGAQTEPTVHNYLVTQNPAAATISNDGSVTGTITGVAAGFCSSIPN